MQSTIRFQGREFQVVKLEEDTTKTMCYAYKLTGTRGADYRLFRNMHNRSRMAVQAMPRGNRGYGRVIEGAWFTDVSGSLEVVA